MQPNLHDWHGMMGSSYDQSKMFGTYASPQEMIQQVDQMQRRCSLMLQNQQISSLTDTSTRTFPSRRQSLDMFHQNSPTDLPQPFNSAARSGPEPSTIATATAPSSSRSSQQQWGDGGKDARRHRSVWYLTTT